MPPALKPCGEQVSRVENMSTPNFKYVNADNAYVLHEFDDDTMDNLRERLHDLVLELGSKDLREYNKNGYDNDQYYPASYYAEVEKSFTFCGVDVCVSAEMSVRGGYYSACNLDFDIKVKCESDWGLINPYYYYRNSRSRCDYSVPRELADDFVDEMIDCQVYENAGVTKGLLVMNKKRLSKRVEAEIFEMVDLANSLCKKLCDDEYACTAVFSNGEAIYEKVS